jgi:hypothetical protein
MAANNPMQESYEIEKGKQVNFTEKEIVIPTSRYYLTKFFQSFNRKLIFLCIL